MTVPNGDPKKDAIQVPIPSAIIDSRTGNGSPASLADTKHIKDVAAAEIPNGITMPK
jgi:hypothetical protein